MSRIEKIKARLRRINHFWKKIRTHVCVFLFLLALWIVVILVFSPNVELYNLTNVATFIEALVVTLAAGFAVAQLVDSSKSRKLTATMEMFNLLGCRKTKAAIKALSELPEYSEGLELTDADQDIIASASHPFNRAGLLFEKGLLEQDILLDMYAEKIVSTWDDLEPYIIYLRNSSKKPQRYQHYFQILYKSSTDYLLLKTS